MPSILSIKSVFLIPMLTFILLCSPVLEAPPPRAEEERVEELVGEALRAALMDDDEMLREATRQLRLHDKRQRAIGRPGSGLYDNLLWLSALPDWGEPGATRFQERGVLQAGADPMLRAQMRDSLRKNPLWRNAQLKRQAALDHAVTPINSFFSAATGLAQGKIEPLLRFGVDLVFYIPGFKKYSRQDGERFGIVAQWLKSPDLPRYSRMQLERIHHSLQPKIDSVLAKNYVRKAQALFEDGEYAYARRMAEAAQELKPDAAGVAALQRKAWRMEDRRKRRIRESNFVRCELEEDLPDNVQSYYQTALTAMLRGEVEILTDRAGRMRYPLSSGPLRGAPDYLRAVAADMRNNRPLALRRLTSSAMIGEETHLGDKARAWRESPDYNMPMLYQRMKSKHRSDTTRYVLLGRRSSHDRLHLLSQTAVVPATAAANLSVFALVDAAVRGVQVALHNPISTDPMRDAGYRVLESEQFKHDVALSRQLARDMLKQAATLAEVETLTEWIPEDNPQLRRKLRQVKAAEAKRLLRMARQHRDVESRRSLYEYLQEKYPYSPEAGKAGKLAAKLPPRQEGETARLDRALARREVAFWRSLGLKLPDEWIDGLTSNGELRKYPAVTMNKEKKDRVTYHLHSGRQVEDAVDSDMGKYLYAAMRLYQLREDDMDGFESMLDYDRRPFEIEGSIGSSGIDIHPRIGKAGERVRETQ